MPEGPARTDPVRLVLAGRQALVAGVANDQSIADGCAEAFHAAGAHLAITWLNETACPYVEKLAGDLAATITGPRDACAHPATSLARRITCGTVHVDGEANIVA